MAHRGLLVQKSHRHIEAFWEMHHWLQFLPLNSYNNYPLGGLQ